MIQSDLLTPMNSITHGFFTRADGVSEGIYAGRNCGLGSDDLRVHVLENRGRVADDLGVNRHHLLTVHQVHSAHVHTVAQLWEPQTAPQADAMVTNQPGIALGILTADCTPVLFADEEAGVIGAAHAGWKGAFNGILSATIDAMIQLGATRDAISCVVGPCISQANYEVGAEFEAGFLDKSATNKTYFIESARQGHRYFDLTGFVTDQLRAQNLRDVETLNLCTYADPHRFYSYRRTTHAGEPDYGRQISALALKDNA